MTDEDSEKIKRVVGLRSGDSLARPTVLLKGAGNTADEVLEEAKKLGLVAKGPPIVEDAALLEQLFRLPVDAPIGRELFELVAIVLLHVYSADERRSLEMLKNLNTKKEGV